MKQWGLWIALFGCLLGVQQAVWAVTGSTQLIEASRKYDRKTVTYQGEAIREAMLRGKNGWINLNDGNNAIGVWTSRENISKIMQYGTYRHTGDRVRVTGVFHRSCPEHGGDLDIHAQFLEVLEPGGVIVHPIPGLKVIVMFLVLASAAVLYYLQKGWSTRPIASS